MTNILTAGEAAEVLRVEITDANMLRLLPLIDAYIKNASGRDWTLDNPAHPTAKSAARMLLVRWFEDPGQMASGNTLNFGLNAAMTQLKALALELAEGGVPNDWLVLMRCNAYNGLDPAASLVLVFNHSLSDGAAAKVSLLDANGAAVTTTKTLDVSGKILTVNPAANLAAQTAYTLLIDNAADRYGQTLQYSLSFRTA